MDKEPPSWLSAGMPCLIKEVPYAPPCPEPVALLWEVALVHHNSSNYDLAVRTYLQGMHKWEAILIAEEEKRRKTDDRVPDPRRVLPQLPVEAQIFVRLAVGGVFDSAAADERALAELLEAQRLCCDNIPQSHPIQAMVDSMLGTVYAHLCQHDLAADHFLRALEVREHDAEHEHPERHVDTGLVLNNIGVCLHCLDRTRDALVMYYRAESIFKQAFRIEHPRLVTVQRNISKAKQFFLKGSEFALPEPREVRVQVCPGRIRAVRFESKLGKKGKKGKKKGK
eukprot:TRINITY_DN2474_c0_g2_i1.p1 TRINITY_DN2474_c0_g2~~TRINITY_DN2474_c0_g2_i1.p1  ORF type:complete len:326 (+),score=147.46 TRINITY_DN2474_c0_g2_i1:135-980(+)